MIACLSRRMRPVRKDKQNMVHAASALGRSHVRHRSVSRDQRCAHRKTPHSAPDEVHSVSTTIGTRRKSLTVCTRTNRDKRTKSCLLLVDSRPAAASTIPHAVRAPSQSYMKVKVCCCERQEENIRYSPKIVPLPCQSCVARRTNGSTFF